MSKTLQKASLFFLNSYTKPQTLALTPAPDKPKKARELNAVDRLFREHWRDVCRVLHACYGSGPPEPEDVAQEAFSRFAQLRNLEKIDDPKAYIIKIAMNITLKSISRLCKTRAFIDEHIQHTQEQCDEMSPETILQAEQRIAAIQKGTEQLSEKQREILMRARIKGQTYTQISTDTGWSVADICRQLNAAMALLESIDEQANNTCHQMPATDASSSNFSFEQK
ncbi:RNA polymerase sigma factor [Paraglaciecola chathamensis]|jgi:RNA polymerase sigma-70 factor (ECF subfamily)|uniref:RNA polymerase sigma-70 factor, ECF subfamily n=1 Tax=Paraglaciecola chathamensis S18K6 TaxID=1127672 RepID=A0AAV3UUQ9_9ALTE|nr:sigma-70 family RNA polymerase sigma factor [Paraglaciecola chathamensis]AEE21763.1 RNA polymerase, sigma-24 subunit, ECF subfamily [Glaciecola sp. 4H-3-7+YE-5]GAC08755.1 RNA polymerase sigma-70 factor, ECF subfamily [Paraglaciecola chathamensis S18K6]